MKEEPQDKRTAVLEATLKLIAEQGFHAAPMSQIAQRANISIGTIYHYFASKEELINALYIHLKTKLSKLLCNVHSENLPEKESFILAINTVSNYFLENPNELFFMEQYNNSPLITSANQEKVNLLFAHGQEYFEKAIKDNIIKELPVEMIHALLHGAMNSLIKLRLSNKVNLSEEFMSIGFEAIWDMIKK